MRANKGNVGIISFLLATGIFLYCFSQPVFTAIPPHERAALVALYTSGVHDGPVVHRGLDYMMQYVPGSIASRSQQHYFYGQYYAVQAAWHAGGTYWEIWYPAVRDELLDLQLGDGSWSSTSYGNEYAAAMALITLQVPNNYLPIFER